MNQELLFSIPDTAIHITKYKGRPVSVYYDPEADKLYVEKKACVMKKYIADYKKMNPEDIHIYRVVNPVLSYTSRNTEPTTTYTCRACDGKQIHMNKNTLLTILTTAPIIQADALHPRFEQSSK